jgi:ATP-dependent RNA helicase RhlE
MLFQELNIIEPILRALEDEGYKSPTPIQMEAIPIILNGNDLLGCAQTGTGKTAAFFNSHTATFFIKPQAEKISGKIRNSDCNANKRISHPN